MHKKTVSLELVYYRCTHGFSIYYPHPVIMNNLILLKMVVHKKKLIHEEAHAALLPTTRFIRVECERTKFMRNKVQK
jgi:hypothetical protein